MYDGPVIDCDVHNSRVSDEDILQYLPQRWRDYAYMPGNGRSLPLKPPGMLVGHPDGTNKRLDSFPDDGAEPGSSHRLLVEQLLDPYNIEHVVLIYDGGEAALPNADFASALCRASNDWLADHWLDGMNDDRIRAALMVPAAYPEEGAKEIRRAAAHPDFVSAYMSYNALAKPLGHPIYHPIYEAAAEVGLPIQLHVSGGEFMGGSAPFVGGGTSHHHRFDVYVVAFEATANHVASMIVHGVFEKYPDLRLLIAESGVSWLPWLALTMESNYELLKRESPWVRKRPMEYLHDHVRLTTQPCEAFADDKREFVEYMSLVDGIEDMLCYSSDYPHWDTDVPTFIGSILPAAWHEKVFYRNAQQALRLPAVVA